LGPRSKRFIDDAPNTQTPLPFAADFAPPPRAPVRDPQRDDEPADVDPAKPSAPKRKRAQGAAAPRRRSKEDFDHLQSVTVECKAADACCPKCDGPLRVIGQAESFRLEWVPGHFVRHHVLRDKCACPSCPDQGVLTVSGPYALNRAMAGNRLVARVLVDKFADHIPLHRQVSRMAREGFEVGSHTLAGWVLQVAVLLRRIADAIRAELLAQRVLQGDDTGLPVQDGGDGRLRKGRMWVITDQHMAFFLFTESKEGEHPVELLEGFSGEVLLVDGGSEFNAVVRQRELERAGCWAHLRTYFHDALEHHPKEARLALGTIRDLFAIERKLWRQAPEVVLAGRGADSKPLVEGFFAWAASAALVTRPDSVLGKALGYALRQRTRLSVFLDRGDVPMHNNLSELMLRQLVVGRKNWLFARSEGGAEAAAIVYTLIASCLLQGIDPELYLFDVLGRILDHPASDIGALTPRRWRLAREQEQSKAAAG
jgi:transposase